MHVIAHILSFSVGERWLDGRELAAIVQLSQYHFSRAFKQSTGLSPHQYVIRQRVERSKLLLKQGKANINDIAVDCGFSHQSHLNSALQAIDRDNSENFFEVVARLCKNSNAVQAFLEE